MTNVVRLDAAVTLADMLVAPSDDGQCLLVYCRGRVVALLSAMGCDGDAFEFWNTAQMRATELIDRIFSMEGNRAGNN